jgi:hypothetical protein
MNRSIATSFALLLLVSGVAHAQFGTLGQAPSRPRPTVSPLITQGTGGGINAFNYYGIIKPQFETNRSISQIQSGMQILNQDGSLQGPLTQAQPNPLGGMQTGHATTFFNHSHYYPIPVGSGMSSGSTSAFGTGLGGASPGTRVFYGNTLNNIVR